MYSCRRQLDDLLLCLAAEDDEDDSSEENDIESILAFYIMNEPPTQLSFTIDLNEIDEKTCIDLFRYVIDCFITNH